MIPTVILFYFLFPVLVLVLAGRYSWVNKIGPVVICYAAGLVLGNSGILPDTMNKYQNNLTNLIIPLSIPLLLFSLDVRSWLTMAKKTFLSLILGVTATLITVLTGFFLLSNRIPECWKVAGMLTGVYTGGTPNLVAIKIALNVNPDTYLITHTCDVLVGAFVLLFLISYGQRAFLTFMRPYQPFDRDTMNRMNENYGEEFESYRGIFSWPVLKGLIRAAIIAMAIVGASVGISIFAAGIVKPRDPGIFTMTTIILLITTLGVIASLFPQISKIRKSFQSGMYLILVFCVIVASMAHLKNFSLQSWPILVYIIIAVPGTFLLHGILSWMFNVDVDNFLIITSALSMSPPFVPVVAGALKNKEIIIPGLVVGIIGYVIGNYLGIMIAFMLR